VKSQIVNWESVAPHSSATIEEIDHFNARGMKPVYGRGDVFPRYRTFHMDIWKNKYNRFYIRFWSRNSDTDWQSFEVIGIDLDSLTVIDKKESTDVWIPQVVRDAYEEWVQCGGYI